MRQLTREILRDLLERTSPPYSISSAVSWRSMLIGIAKPIPMLPSLGSKIAVLMPTSSLRGLNNAPPELHGLIEASLWWRAVKPIARADRNPVPSPCFDKARARAR
jgi:hypothetical protein